jgi:electron transport complex protein RnfB
MQPLATARSSSAPDMRAGPATPAHEDLASAVDALLPQTQCGRCGFAGCLPYARALAAGQAEINRCPPGGDAGVQALARLLGRRPIALDPDCGTPRPLHLARIDETRCIGCTLCIQACPVDAISGAVKLMHTVLADACTGCELCLAPCPMDCIAMVPPEPPRDWTRADAQRARDRLHARTARLAREQAENEARLDAKALQHLAELEAGGGLDEAERARRRGIVEQALARARRRRADEAAARGRDAADPAPPGGGA